MPADDPALFLPDGDRFVATELTRGPWSPDAQHGGPPAALLAREIERTPGGDGMLVTRLTVELLRPVPLAPLSVTARLTRPGRKVQLVEARLRAGETEVARAVGLRIRTTSLPLPPLEAPAGAPPPPESGRPSQNPWARTETAFHRDAVEHRFVVGSFAAPGPATDWIRLRVPLVAGEETSPVCRVAAAADFGNGISWTLPRDGAGGYLFINPDLTIYLHRLPVDEWVCLEATTWPQPHGVGLAESRLWDRRGFLGRSLQSLLLERG